MTSARSQHQLGVALVAGAAIAWSTAPLFIRLLPLDAWSILFWRGLFGGGFIFAMMILLHGRAGLRDFKRLEASSVLVASLFTVAMLCFIPALQLTSVSNVAIMIATQPFVTAAVAWIWLREAPRWQTMLASIVAVSGIAIIVGGIHTHFDLVGIALTCLMITSLAVMTVAVRRYKNTPMVAAAAWSNLLGSLVSIPFAQQIASIGGLDLAVLALFGFFQIALGLILYVLGSRRLPSGQASLIATLETPLMPFWIWLAFHEMPAPRELVGGVLVIGAVIADILSDDHARA
jgi:drug/metabolite transporter (DMT)-like permease